MSFWHSHNSQMLVVLFISMAGTHPPQKCPFKSFFSLNSAAGKLCRNTNFLLRFKKYIGTRCKIICQPGVEILSWEKCLQAVCKLTSHYKNVRFSFSENEKILAIIQECCLALSAHLWPYDFARSLLASLICSWILSWEVLVLWGTCRWRGLAITQFLSQVWASPVLK